MSPTGTLKVSNKYWGNYGGQLLTATKRMKWLGQSKRCSVVYIDDGGSNLMVQRIELHRNLETVPQIKVNS